MENKKKEMIADFALQTEENFLLSAQVEKSFEEIMNRLIGKLLKKLKKQIEVSLGPEWDIDSGFDDNSFNKWYFVIFKKAWIQNEWALYYFGFAPDNRKLGNFYFYANRNGKVVNKPINAVYQALNEHYKPGRKNAVTDWYQYIDQDYKNWTNEETLVKLYHQEDMVEYFAEQFTKIKDIIEPIVDEEMKKYCK